MKAPQWWKCFQLCLGLSTHADNTGESGMFGLRFLGIVTSSFFLFLLCPSLSFSLFLSLSVSLSFSLSHTHTHTHTHTHNTISYTRGRQPFVSKEPFWYLSHQKKIIWSRKLFQTPPPPPPSAPPHTPTPLHTALHTT